MTYEEVENLIDKILQSVGHSSRTIDAIRHQLFFNLKNYRQESLNILYKKMLAPNGARAHAITMFYHLAEIKEDIFSAEEKGKVGLMANTLAKYAVDKKLVTQTD